MDQFSRLKVLLAIDKAHSTTEANPWTADDA